MDEKALEGISTNKKFDPERGRSQLMSPNPNRVKFLTELLAALTDGKITFAQVAKLDRKKMKQLAEQGYVKLKHGRFDEARKVFEILTFVDHKNYFHHLALGGAYQKLKKYLDAVFQYTECLKYDPENTNALVNRGEVFLRHKNYKKAAEDFRQAIVADKSGRDVFANRARSLVIAIKRSLAKAKGESKATKLPASSPIQRRTVAPLSLLGKSDAKPAKAGKTKKK